MTAVEQAARMDQTTSVDLTAAVRGCTFDDFLFTPKFGVIERRDPDKIDLTCQLSEHVRLRRPFVSANMDTVTRAPMAIVQAEEGGIGVIDRGFKVGDIESQVREVEIVKRTQHGVIADPYTISVSASLAEAVVAMDRSRVGTLVVVDGHCKLKGLLTQRDVRFVADAGHGVAARMTPLEEVVVHVGSLSIGEAERIMVERKIKKLPLVDEQGVLTGLITATDIMKQKRLPFATRDAHGRLRVGAAIGAKGDYLERAADLIRAGVDVLVIDIAHGHSVVMERALTEFRRRFGDFELIAGNVATPEGGCFLAERGVNDIKVGVGPGGGCTTRISTSFGVPQLQALVECSTVVAGRVPHCRRRGSAGWQCDRGPAVWRRLRHAGQRLCRHAGDARRHDPQVGGVARVSKGGEGALRGPARDGITRHNQGPAGR